MSPAQARSRVLALCQERGFARVGIAPAGTLPHGAFFSQWLKRGYHGTMAWLERAPQFREDIRVRYPWVKSFVMLAMDYASELNQDLPDDSVVPNVARYARGLDYHKVYKTKLLDLQRAIKQLVPGTQALWYQDTGPFLERELASMAGLGWQGKNTLVIDPQSGSWKLLALVVTSLEVEADAPAIDHCGTCTACIDACPTEAFPEPYVLDARRCISYLTIEHQGAIAPELREGMGEWIFGCDICQSVCPWNSKAPKLEADVPEGLAELSLSDVLSAKEDQLAARIAGTPLERAGTARLRRNAAIAAGNLRDPELVPALERAARHPETYVREAAYWALKRMGSEARGAMSRAQRYESDDDLREAILDYLQNQS